MAFLPFAFALVVLGTGCNASINSSPLWAPAMSDSLAETGPEIDPMQLALTIHQNTNEVRQSEGLHELTWNDEISKIARSHSEDMAINGYFSHTNKKGESASERASRLGFSGIQTNPQYVVVGIGENLFATHKFEEYMVTQDSLEQIQYFVKWKDVSTIANEAVQAWLDSSPHRNNLLSTTYSVQGIGVSVGSNGTVFVTQNLN